MSSTTSTPSRITQAFKQAAAEQRAAFIPYITAGFPNKEAFLGHARTLLEYADVLEIGLPYSDPLGDGPTIQKSSETALANGTHIADAFDFIRQLRQESDKALVLMTYYNPIFVYPKGEAGFIQDLKEAGADGIILPDLPPDEGKSLIAAARATSLDTIFLVAPTSTQERLALVTAACRGFVYAVSVTGVTGARDSLANEVPDLVARAKAETTLPIAVGFGVKNAATAKPIAEVADGVVVGSALINTINENGDLAALCAEIRQASTK